MGIQQLAALRQDIVQVYSTQLGSWSVPTDELLACFQAFEKPATTEFPKEEEEKKSSQAVQDELQSFLNSAVGSTGSIDDDDDGASYTSDNGTRYVKVPSSKKWIHEALAEATGLITSKQPQTQTLPDGSAKKRKRSNNKSKFTARHAKNWIYVTGLPSDTTTEELQGVFSKAGLLDLDPETQQPKIKLYSDSKTGIAKGDASLCFAHAASVNLAIRLFDDGPFRLDRPTQKMKVQHAKFQQKGEFQKKKSVSLKKKQVARLAALQAVGWDQDDNGRITGGKKGLCIVVFQHLFTPQELSPDEDACLAQLEQEMMEQIFTTGKMEKLTFFSKHPDGIAIVKFAQPSVASDIVHQWNGKEFRGRRLIVKYWDGVTDYTAKAQDDDGKEDERHEEFGNWLESQELPEELRLQVESS